MLNISTKQAGRHDSWSQYWKQSIIISFNIVLIVTPVSACGLSDDRVQYTNSRNLYRSIRFVSPQENIYFNTKGITRKLEEVKGPMVFVGEPNCQREVNFSKDGFKSKMVTFDACEHPTPEAAAIAEERVTIVLQPESGTAADVSASSGTAAASRCSTDDLWRMSQTMPRADIERICGASAAAAAAGGSPEASSDEFSTQTARSAPPPEPASPQPLTVGCLFTPNEVYLRCDEEASTELTVEVISQGRPVPGADIIVEGGGCAPLTRYEDVIRGTTDGHGVFEATCSFGFDHRGCDTYADGSPDIVSPAHVTATAPGYGEAYTQCSWLAKVPLQ